MVTKATMMVTTTTMMVTKKTSQPDRSPNRSTVIGLSVSGACLALAAAAVLLLVCCRRRRSKRGTYDPRAATELDDDVSVKSQEAPFEQIH